MTDVPYVSLKDFAATFDPVGGGQGDPEPDRSPSPSDGRRHRAVEPGGIATLRRAKLLATPVPAIALFLMAEHGVTEGTIGYFFAYIGILNIIMRLVLLGPIVDRVGETRAMRIGAAALILGLIGYPLATSIWQLVLVIPLVPVGTALLFPATTSLMTRYSDKTDIGTTMGVAQTYAGIARIAAPILGTLLFQRLGHQWPFIAAACMMALVSVLAFQVDQLPSPTGETPVPIPRVERSS